MGMPISQIIIANNQPIKNNMKRISLLLTFVFTCIGLFSQANYDAFVGTWVYQRNDTVFKIKLQKGTVKYDQSERAKVFGGYYLSVKGVIKEDYIKTTPTIWDVNIPAPSCNIYIDAYSTSPDYLGFVFYDQRKKHINGAGLPCGAMELTAPNKLHWKLNEKEGIYAILEGSGEDMTLRGFSVPDDVIMTKE